MNLLVTGGAGYIGSVIVEELVGHGHDIVVYDNLSTGHRDAVSSAATFIEGDLRDIEKIRSVLAHHSIEAVIHMAASSIVSDSVTAPEKYYDNNVTAGEVLLDAMVSSRVNKIVFSSTAAVYGDPKTMPITEDASLKPKNPYGETKLKFEQMLASREKRTGLSHISLRYFNAAGATETNGERHEPETHLIPLVIQAGLGIIPEIEIFGDDYDTNDGTCIRDYIHVSDLARAHILALDALEANSGIYNLGCGRDGYSVREIIDRTSEVTGLTIPTKICARRAGDPAVLIASSKKAKTELGWEPNFYNIDEIIASVWRWMNR